ncbi:hypothetical protein [Atopomonas sediminilitoris]|uniref:hypothetical protein n=1 Tax=Atopomonas sediminilitoris TaxID=2919919 RepID=UPI001F4DBB21|nr:hypothetical protein [Atopomonas sediminilitoris]MCJ8167876.1 hypothetical protein [Atopomonas sediminilitoris]
MSQHKSPAALPPERKLQVLCRVEPGCLGSNGAELIEGFCQFAEPLMNQHETALASWQLVPRYDKTLAEVQFSLQQKRLSDEHVARYLQALGRDFDSFEDELHRRLANLIDEYLGR